MNSCLSSGNGYRISTGCVWLALFLPFRALLGIISSRMNGVILLNKPAGITSFDAVARCRRILKEKKIGHTGTLDPNASGLLIILTGKYTKLLPYCVSDRKTYKAGFTLGKKTDTQDIWGTVLAEKQPAENAAEELEKAAGSFLGAGKQLPPMYSAIKVNGKKLYEYARSGVEIERRERDIFIHSLAVRHCGGADYEMDATVSSGTYIRTLISDLAGSAGEYACMTSLVRTAISDITLDMACTLEQLAEHPEAGDPSIVLDPAVKIIACPDLKAMLNGRDLDLGIEDELAAVTADGEIKAVYRRLPSGMYHCERGIF